MSVRDQILNQLPTLDEAMDELNKPESSEPEDEVVAAIRRQVTLLEGVVVMIGNAWQMLTMQVENLRAELDLLDKPLLPHEQRLPEQPQVQRTPRGAIVEATLPEERRLPGFCDHEDALMVATANGPVRVCPECDG